MFHRMWLSSISDLLEPVCRPLLFSTGSVERRRSMQARPSPSHVHSCLDYPLNCRLCMARIEQLAATFLGKPKVDAH